MEFLVWVIFGAVALLVDVLANKQKRQRQRERAQQPTRRAESSRDSYEAVDNSAEDFSFEEYQAEMERQWREEQTRKRLGDLAPERTVVWEDVAAEVPWESSTVEEPTKKTPYVAVPTVDGGFMIPVPPIPQEPAVEERHSPVTVSIQPTTMPTAVPRVGAGHKPVTDWAQRARRRGRISRSEARTAVVWMEILGKPKGLA